MRFECPNCGCLNEYNPLNDRMHIVIKEFKEKNCLSLCSIIDEEGFIIISETYPFITKPLERKIVAFYRALEEFSSQYSELINFKQKIETFSLIRDLDPALDGFILLIKSITKTLVLLTLVPGDFNIAEILKKYKKIVKKLSMLIIENDLSNTIEKSLFNVQG